MLLSIGLSFLIFRFRQTASFGNTIDPIYHLWLFGPTIASLILLLIIKNDSFSMISFKKIQNVKAFLVVIVTMILVIILSGIIQYLLGFISFQRNDQFFFLFNHQFTPLVGSFIWLVLLLIHAGFAEEFAWRGYLFSKLKNLSWVEIILVLNTIWAVWHFPFMPFQKVYQYILFWFLCIEFGVVLVYVRIKTKSVISAMILHPVVVFSLSVIFTPYFNVINTDGAGWPNYIIALLFLPISIYYFTEGQKLHKISTR